LRVALPSSFARLEASEFVSLAERVNYLHALRLGFAFVVLSSGVLASEILGSPRMSVILVTGCYLFAAALAEGIRRLAKGPGLAILGAMLLVDGLYLAWVMYATGGTQSPLRFLAYVHVVAVTLLASYRTGLKVAVWHSLLLFVVFYAQSTGILDIRELAVSSLPGRGDFETASMLNIIGLWGVALGTATFSGVNERELRRQKADLEELSEMVAEMEKRNDSSDIPRILLDSLTRGFGFTRGVVLASPHGELSMMAYHGPGRPREPEPGLDRVVQAAWDKRETQLVKELNRDADPRLTALLPAARDLLIVPLYTESYRLGVLALEYQGKGDRIKRWIVAIVQQFAAHAALALHNAWLLEEIRQMDEADPVIGPAHRRIFQLYSQRPAAAQGS
jgi:two-component system cell cycle response regulator